MRGKVWFVLSSQQFRNFRTETAYDLIGCVDNNNVYATRPEVRSLELATQIYTSASLLIAFTGQTSSQGTGVYTIA